jgi:hypothetical protein
MKTLTFTTANENQLTVNPKTLIGKSTNSLYVRKGFKNGTLFLSQKGNGQWGAGDVCKLSETNPVLVNENLFDRISILASK